MILHQLGTHLKMIGNESRRRANTKQENLIGRRRGTASVSLGQSLTPKLSEREMERACFGKTGFG